MFVGAGDIASCAITEDTDTGNIIAGIEGNVWTTGDNVYDNGTAAEFTNCYATTPWGSPGVKDRTRPVPGNHDWGVGNTNSLAGYNGYFGAAATDTNGKSYYSYDIPVATGTSSRLVRSLCGPRAPHFGTQHNLRPRYVRPPKSLRFRFSALPSADGRAWLWHRACSVYPPRAAIC